MAKKNEGEYHGRLMADGEGNLLADESRTVGSVTVAVHDENGDPVLNELGQQVEVTVPKVKYGKNHRRPVARDKEAGTFIFVPHGEPSHNDRHHKQFITVTGTVDESMTDDPDLVNVTKTENQHHFGPLPDDPHYAEGATNSLGKVTNVRAKTDDDRVAATVTGHTDAWGEGDDD